MKIVIVSFPEATDVSSLTVGLTPVAVGVVAGGEVLMVGQLPDIPEPELDDHSHPATIGPPIP